jgi:Transposase DDE domain
MEKFAHWDPLSRGRGNDARRRCDLRQAFPSRSTPAAAARRSLEGTAGHHPGYAISQRIRKRVEEAFGWAKTVAGLRKMRHRGLLKVDWQFTLAIAAYDLVRLPKLLA